MRFSELRSLFDKRFKDLARFLELALGEIDGALLIANSEIARPNQQRSIEIFESFGILLLLLQNHRQVQVGEEMVGVERQFLAEKRRLLRRNRLSP